MKILKLPIKKLLSVFGYEVRRASGKQMDFSLFANLVQAYEQRLNELDNVVIEPNELRPGLLARLIGTLPSEAYFIIQALAKCRDINGDICEFGVAQGETSALIANEIRAGNKALHLFDSFEGLPQPTEKDRLLDDIFSLGSMEAYAGTMSWPEKTVRSRLQDIAFPEHRFVIHKGFIEQTFLNDTRLPAQVSFAYVDLDFYEPTQMALAFLHQRTPPGAIIIVDDYGFFSTGVKTAVDEFTKERNQNKAVYECLIPDPRYGYFAVLTKQRA